MKKRALVIGMSLALSLSLGVVGCKASSSSSTTIETSVTDEDGNTETNRTETVTETDEEGNTETSTTTTTKNSSDESGGLTYKNKAFGFEAVLPERYKQVDNPESQDNEETVLCAADDDDNELLIVYRDMSIEPSFDDEYKWADEYSDGVIEVLQQIGDNISEANLYDNVTLAGASCTLFEVRSTDVNGDEWYRDYFFFLVDTDEGPQGLRIQFFCKGQEQLDELENSFVSLS